jgi:UPF0042 nucleotide-binding protein
MTENKRHIIIVTGLAGAGMSSALKHLEDLGYEVFDNFPLTLVDALIADTQARAETGPHNAPHIAPHVAIGIDSRTRGFDPAAIVDTVKRNGASLLYMTAADEVLLRRFTETRRRHPLAKDRPASAGISRDKELLGELRDKADTVIDSSHLSVHDLRRLIEAQVLPEAARQLTVTLMSFGFRNGVPPEADIVMDARFLQNPHWVPELRPLSGRDAAVGAYIEEDPAFAGFLEHFKTLLAPLLPRYAQEGKSYFTLALGCTGGRHRSVYIIETLKPWFEEQGFKSHVVHRDLK